ncbi:hypothetical protein GLOTRDRAFT_80624 [Gloeophyllum trabeum ATCC 11539]|uniref:GRIP domain-containing protein n=1 Tax=Gloeophyllum trabeum (strain ATCC 11539 / FP-39264 / Madison 617) TaxID=670483 RepID=S7PXK5_GLOTA|nr:uncharacterized protein GLOTRDRAFT_80624 [Gloeophyllum trabeum ATCC 11539]EPQ52346.1 hypothetical protein GLOTRDRAFT_80624 [Gloeophyllum trabeum ATCC 11539]
MSSPSPTKGLISPLLSPQPSTPRGSLEGDRSNAPPSNTNAVNGHSYGEDEDSDPVQRLRDELERTKEEKEALAAQYRNLLGKLTTMRTTLQNKLKQDAEELERREQLVQQLTAENEDLVSTVETLKSELLTSNEEAEKASRELEAMRSRALQETAQETIVRERELRELQSELERCRIEKDEWEHAALHERTFADEARATIETLQRDLEIEREAREREAAQLESEREKANNLQSVLEDFQTAKEHELKQAVKEHEDQFNQLTQSLAEYKHRALTAELQLEESTSNSSRIQNLEKEVKEKELLIQKLRHEAIIMNEHLMEALRRLRRQSSADNVDRRLVTNVLLSFLVTPRADSKRFEMLQLLASILQWSDAEREKAGLQRTGQNANTGSSIWSRSASSTSLSATKSPELEKSDETESFSRLWVEFLLTEANAGQNDSAISPPPDSQKRGNNSLPGSPTRLHHLSPGSPLSPRRLASFSSASAMASSPNLSLPPSRKGKEKEVVL